MMKMSLPLLLLPLLLSAPPASSQNKLVNVTRSHITKHVSSYQSSAPKRNLAFSHLWTMQDVGELVAATSVRSNILALTTSELILFSENGRLLARQEIPGGQSLKRPRWNHGLLIHKNNQVYGYSSSSGHHFSVEFTPKLSVKSAGTERTICGTKVELLAGQPYLSKNLTSIFCDASESYFPFLSQTINARHTPTGSLHVHYQKCTTKECSDKKLVIKAAGPSIAPVFVTATPSIAYTSITSYKGKDKVTLKNMDGLQTEYPIASSAVAIASHPQGLLVISRGNKAGDYLVGILK